MKDNKLEVGDVLYVDSWRGTLQRHTVTRVTPSQAMCKTENYVGDIYETKFKREISADGKTVREIGGGFAYIETPEYICKWERKLAYDRVSALMTRFKPGLLTTDQLNKVYNFLKPLSQL